MVVCRNVLMSLPQLLKLQLVLGAEGFLEEDELSKGKGQKMSRSFITKL